MSPLKTISEAEQDVLKVLWDRGSGTARDVLDVLTKGGRDWAYTTAKTLLDRLEAKGYVERDRSATAHVFIPVVDKEEFLRSQARALRDDLFKGESTPLAHAFLDGLDLTPAEIDELRASLDKMAKQPRRRSRS